MLSDKLENHQLALTQRMVNLLNLLNKKEVGGIQKVGRVARAVYSGMMIVELVMHNCGLVITSYY